MKTNGATGMSGKAPCSFLLDPSADSLYPVYRQGERITLSCECAAQGCGWLAGWRPLQVVLLSFQPGACSGPWVELTGEAEA